MTLLDPIFFHSPLGYAKNHAAERAQPWPAALDAVFPIGELDDALREVSSWEGYRPTPLRSFPELASLTGVGEVLYKDEASRFGLGSFKALGGAYAVARSLAAALSTDTEKFRPCDIFAGRANTASQTVASATDGNHGRSVAWGARRARCRAVIYIHADVSASRESALANLGAEVIRVDGNYDDSVAEAQAAAERNGWLLVADTTDRDDDPAPGWVMAGYGVMVDEVLAATTAPPTHVFVQGGVGGLAGALLARFWQRCGPERPRFVVVEPALAACLFESARQGHASDVEVKTETLMAGLSCGEASRLAWQVLAPGAEDFLTIEDHLVGPSMLLLADGKVTPAPIVAGESAVAGLAALVALSNRADLRENLMLDDTSRVLLIGSEGATDETIFTELVGQSSDAIDRTWRGAE